MTKSQLKQTLARYVDGETPEAIATAIGVDVEDVRAALTSKPTADAPEPKPEAAPVLYPPPRGAMRPREINGVRVHAHGAIIRRTAGPAKTWRESLRDRGILPGGPRGPKVGL